MVAAVAAAAVVLLLLLLFAGYRAWFHRDPVRIAPEGEGVIVAPADGNVIYIKPFRDGQVVSEKLGRAIAVEEITKAPPRLGHGWILGIYMSPLDVHFNYAPVAARVKGVVHTRARFNLPMVDFWEYVRLTYLRRTVDLFSHRYRLVNERMTLFLDAGWLELAVVEIADKFVNKIRCFANAGDSVRLGQKISFIERGSQVDLVIFGDGVEFTVKVGQQVYGARTVIARRSAPPPAAGTV